MIVSSLFEHSRVLSLNPVPPSSARLSRVWHRLAGTGTGPAQPAGCAAARWIASTCVG